MLLRSARSKTKDWLVQNQDNVPEWSDMSTRDIAEKLLISH
jgi:hypothetical protein